MTTARSSNSANQALKWGLILIVGVVAYYKLLPSVLRALRGRGSSGGAGGGGAFGGPSPSSPLGGKPPASGGPLNALANALKGNPNSASDPNAFQYWVNKSQSDLTSYFKGFSPTASYDSAALDSITIPSVQLQSLDNLPSQPLGTGFIDSLASGYDSMALDSITIPSDPFQTLDNLPTTDLTGGYSNDPFFSDFSSDPGSFSGGDAYGFAGGDYGGFAGGWGDGTGTWDSVDYGFGSFDS